MTRITQKAYLRNPLVEQRPFWSKVSYAIIENLTYLLLRRIATENVSKFSCHDFASMALEQALMSQVGVPTQATQPVDSSQVDRLFKSLKEHDADWLSRTLYERWIQLSDQQPRRKDLHHESCQDSFISLDFTLPHLPESLYVSDYIKFIREWDWGATELGPMSKWSIDLRIIANKCLVDKQAVALWLGPRHVAFYNEGYAIIAGKKHPNALGRPFVEMWPEPGIVDKFSEVLNHGHIHNQSTAEAKVQFVLSRNGFREETWASWTVVPVLDCTGRVLGCYMTVFDCTHTEVSGRRLTTLLSLYETAGAAASIDGLWQHVVAVCVSNPRDVCFAAVYSAVIPEGPVDTDNVSRMWRRDFADRQDDSDTKTWKLQGTARVPAEYTRFTETLDTKAGMQLISPDFAAMLGSDRNPVLLSVDEGTFPEDLHVVYQDTPVTKALLIPVGPTSHNNVLGFILIGLNPLIVFDSDYEQFAQMLMRQCANSIASLILMDEEVREARLDADQAAQQQLLLTAKLMESQDKVVENELRFRAMADMAPVALCQLDAEGEVIYANNNWFEVTQHPVGPISSRSWEPFIHPDDRERSEREWERLIAGESVNFEMRWLKPYVPDIEEYVGGERVEGSTWTIVSAYCERYPDGSLKGILSCLTDISRQKWIEGFQERRVKEALELKRQQENFMDMISHETRNPLSAIMLSVENIGNGLQEYFKLKHDPICISRDTVRLHLEGIETIMACAQHQKRIVDDVLTLSKLDSSLLTICPVDTRPVDTISQSIKMFDAEVKKQDITVQFNIDQSYSMLGVDWVRVDPSRLLQVLINLLTNAIKFTTGQPVRMITVTLAASEERPTASLHDCPYVQNEWNDASQRASDQVFLSIEVIDTGRGITPEEMKKLFQKFQQASPKTHVEYGGSGLGLFISKQLSRMQGGAIGVASAGKGATFAFYVQATRCEPPRGYSLRKSTSLPSLTDSAESSRAHSRETDQRRRFSLSEDVGLSRAQPEVKTPKHILLVEDNLVNQKVMRTMLERAQFTVQIANHGLEALDYMAKTQFSKADGFPLDVILLDVEMPVCDGLDCARRIRALQEAGSLNAHVPIVGVTANARTEQKQAAITAGMDSVVTKPFRMQELSAELERIMERFY